MENKFFFWRSTSDNFFCHMLSLLCTLPFGVFSGQHISHQFRQQTFFFCPHFQQTFFSDFCGDKLFFSILFWPPPPQISNGASLIILVLLQSINYYIKRYKNIYCMSDSQIFHWRQTWIKNCFQFCWTHDSVGPPSNHDILNQCWFNVGLALQTLGQH